MNGRSIRPDGWLSDAGGHNDVPVYTTDLLGKVAAYEDGVAFARWPGLFVRADPAEVERAALVLLAAAADMRRQRFVHHIVGEVA